MNAPPPFRVVLSVNTTDWSGTLGSEPLRFVGWALSVVQPDIAMLIEGTPIDWMMFDSQSAAVREGVRQASARPEAVLVIHRPDGSVFDAWVFTKGAAFDEYRSERKYDWCQELRAAGVKAYEDGDYEKSIRLLRVSGVLDGTDDYAAHCAEEAGRLRKDHDPPFLIGPMGGPQFLRWNREPRQAPAEDFLANVFERVRTSWSRIAGPDLALHTRPLRFTGRRKRRLLVWADPSHNPPWGTWHMLAAEPARSTFRAFRVRINDTIAPHAIDHVGFTSEG